MSNYLALEDFVAGAKRRLPRSLHSYVVGGAEKEASLRENEASFDEYAFIPRIMVDVSSRNSSVELFGRMYSAPFGIAPMGGAALVAYQGDLALARAAAELDIPMIVSAASLIALENIRKAGATTWCQVYLGANTESIEAMTDRVARAGFDTLVVTADVPVIGNREGDIRHGFSVPMRPSLKLLWDGITHPTWLVRTCLRTLLRHGVPRLENMGPERGNPIISRHVTRTIARRDAFDWTHFKMVRARWKGRLVLKGVLALEDARIAAGNGADGIIISNHGGRQLDGAIAPLRVLPEIAAKVSGVTIMLDGGVRRGSDVLKALALGAQFVFVGRPFLCAAAVEGQSGVRQAIRLLSEELDRNMALLGLTTIGEINREFVRFKCA